VNGDIAPADSSNSMSNNGPKPSAERCRLPETGDQLQNDIASPLSATSPVSENGEDCYASVSGHEDCSGVGAFDIEYFSYVCGKYI